MKRYEANNGFHSDLCTNAYQPLSQSNSFHLKRNYECSHLGTIMNIFQIFFMAQMPGTAYTTGLETQSHRSHSLIEADLSSRNRRLKISFDGSFPVTRLSFYPISFFILSVVKRSEGLSVCHRVTDRQQMKQTESSHSV